MMCDDTIFALATTPGRSAIAVVRISGPGTASVLTALAGTLPAPRRAVLRRLRDPASQETLDRALVLWFPRPGSYTGEDAGELHLHGGLAVIEGVVDRLLRAGLRSAEPGEFTRRAFENQRLDLTEAEAVADLIEAQTAGQRRQALAQLGGALQATVADWRGDLLEALGYLEASVDFPDEDVPSDVMARCRPALERVRTALREAAQDRRGEQVRQGFKVALLGAPNVGKSSLINALLGRDAAIVSATPGTTRDVVEGVLQLAGHAVVLADTAGLRTEVVDEIEAEGMRRARRWAASADLRLHLTAPDVDGVAVSGTTEDDVVVRSKADLASGSAETMQVGGALEVSTRTGEGLEALRAFIAKRASAAASGEPPIATRARHRAIFADAIDAIEAALVALDVGASPEFAAEDVRAAARRLEAVSGRIDSEDVLGRIFSTFCVGK